MFVDRVGKLPEGDTAPLYQQLQRVLRAAIERQVLAPDEALPPERDLAQAYNVSRVTVRKALDGLVDARMLTRRQGAGTFVAARVEKNFATISSFTEDMQSRGRVPHSEWLARTEGTVAPEEAMALGLSPGSQVYRFTRIRYADGVSMAEANGYTHSGQRGSWIHSALAHFAQKCRWPGERERRLPLPSTRAR